MDIVFKCARCNQLLRTEVTDAGKEVSCPRCEKLIVVPAGSDPEVGSSTEGVPASPQVVADSVADVAAREPSPEPVIPPVFPLSSEETTVSSPIVVPSPLFGAGRAPEAPARSLPLYLMANDTNPYASSKPAGDGKPSLPPGEVEKGIVPPLDFDVRTPVLREEAGSSTASVGEGASGNPEKPLVRIADMAAVASYETWRDLAATLALQLWNQQSASPLGSALVEKFLRAMPLLAEDATRPGRWVEPFANGPREYVARIERPSYEGNVTAVAALIQSWMHHQEALACQASDVQEIKFSVMTLPGSAVVNFGMNFMQINVKGRRRVGCWVGRVRQDQFVFGGKLPPQAPAATHPAAAEAVSHGPEWAVENSLPLPREVILQLPVPPGFNGDETESMRQLIIGFCDAHFGRHDNRMAGEVYDKIRQRRDLAKAILPGVLTAMPASKEKRMLQQLYRDL